MSNSYGIPDYLLRQLAEQYLAEQEGGGAEEAPMLTGEQQNFANAIPMYDLEGDPQSYTSMFNQLQDFNQLLADPLFQGGGGPGGFSQQAFAPTVNYEVVDSPEYQRWMNYLNTPDSPEGMIAAELQGGGTPLSAIRKIQEKVTENPEGQLAQQLAMFFPAVDSYGTPTGEIDWTLASDTATEIDEIRAQVPPIGGTGSLTMPDGTIVPAGEIMEVDGQLVKRTEQPSELMEHFNELGLPSPFEEYTPEMFMGPDWAATRDEWEATTAAEQDQLQQAMRDAYQAKLDYRPPAGEPGAPLEGSARPEETAVEAPAGEVAPPVPGYPARPIDVSGEIPQALDEAIRNRTDAQWMEQNWANLPQREQTNVREVLASYGLSPQIYGIEVREPEEHPGVGETLGGVASAAVGTPDVGPASEAGYRPGEVTAQLEGVMTTPQGAESWLAGNYANLSPEEETEVRQVLAGHGLTVEDLMPEGGGAQGFMGGVQLGGEVPAGATQQTIPRGTLSPERTAAIQNAMWNRLTGEQEEPPPYAQPGAEPARQPGDYTPQPQAQAEPYPAAAMWPPTLIYDPWAEHATEETMRQNLYRPPPGGYPTLEAAAAAGSVVAQRYLEENAPTPPNVPDEGYTPPPGGYPTLEQAAAAGSPASQRYLEEAGYTTPRSRPTRHPEAPLGGVSYEQQLTEDQARAQARRDAMLAAVLPQGATPRRQGGPPPSEAATIRTGETGLEPATEDQIAQYLELATQNPRRSGALATGERGQTPEQRRQLLWDVADPRTEFNRRESQNRFGRAVRAANRAGVQRGVERQQIYGADWGRAVRAVYNAQLSGATPLQQVYAQRVQNVANAGIPIGAQPGLISYT